MINQSRIQEWVELYLEHIQKVTPEAHVSEEEGYKFKAVENFQKNFDENASDFAEMLGRAILPNNLVLGSWYFPRKMLFIFATDDADQTRTILRALFDESKPAGERIDSAEASFDILMAERNKRLGEESHHFMGVRFLSLLLGYRYPDVHDALKPREWRSFCKFIDSDFAIPSGTSSGAQYEAFRPYVEALRKTILTMPEVDSLRKELTDGLRFKDAAFHWMAQDVIYVTSRVIAKGGVEDVGAEDLETETAEEESAVEEEEREAATIDDRFAYEDDLQNFVTENFDKLQLGAKLSIYTDSQGRTGTYYPTEYGEIDILATDEQGNYVVLELKRDRAADQAVNQLGRYMQWVDENLASKEGKSVRGILLAHRGNRALLGSVRALRFPVEIVYYSIALSLNQLH